MRRGIVAVLVLGVLGLAGPPAAADPFEWSGELAPGKVIEIRGYEGDVRAELVQGNKAAVTTSKSGKRKNFEDVVIRMVETRRGVTICATYAWWEEGKNACDFRKRHGSKGRNDVGVRVDFVVQVPAGVELIARTISGKVEAEGLESRVDASSVDGDVTVSTTEAARGSTVSGNVAIAMGSTDWNDLDYSTVSGNITLTLPDDLQAKIDFKSLSGDFQSDFDISTRGPREDKLVGSELKGSIGKGGPRLSFRTVSGDVRLRHDG